MSLWDYFVPDPPLECPRCPGALSGWETRNEGGAFFIWRQGAAEPIGQNVDPGIATTQERRASFRLPEEFRIHYGECKECGYKYHGAVICKTDSSRVWISAEFEPPAKIGGVIADGWLQCPECCDAFEIIPPKRLYICPSCQSFVRVPAVVS